MSQYEKPDALAAHRVVLLSIESFSMRQPNTKCQSTRLGYLARMSMSSYSPIPSNIGSIVAGGTTCDAVDDSIIAARRERNSRKSGVFLHDYSDGHRCGRSTKFLSSPDEGIDALANAGFAKGNSKAILVENPTKSDVPLFKPVKSLPVSLSRAPCCKTTVALTDVRRYVIDACP